jgi:hypothetical protein
MCIIRSFFMLILCVLFPYLTMHEWINIKQQNSISAPSSMATSRHEANNFTTTTPEKPNKDIGNLSCYRKTSISLLPRSICVTVREEETILPTWPDGKRSPFFAQYVLCRHGVKLSKNGKTWHNYLFLSKFYVYFGRKVDCLRCVVKSVQWRQLNNDDLLERGEIFFKTFARLRVL